MQNFCILQHTYTGWMRLRLMAKNHNIISPKMDKTLKTLKMSLSHSFHISRSVWRLWRFGTKVWRCVLY